MNYPIIEAMKKVEIVEKHLTDNVSRKIYDMYLNYLVSQDIDEFQRNILTLDQKLTQFPSEFDTIYKSVSEVESIVIFGAGDMGHLALFMLKNSKYKNIEILFCDNDSHNKNSLTSRID